METQRQAALKGKITDQMAEVARQEGLEPEVIRERVARGTIAICANINHKNLIKKKTKAVNKKLIKKSVKIKSTITNVNLMRIINSDHKR